MSKIVDFYQLLGTDTEGDTLIDMWHWSDEELEFCHSFIQWWFPLKEPSNFNPDAPILSEEDITCFKNSDVMRTRLITSTYCFLEFMGLDWDKDYKVIKGDNWDAKIDMWKHINHNWLRVTRMLTSLRTLGCEDVAKNIFAFLEYLHKEEKLVSENSFDYWQKAMQ